MTVVLFLLSSIVFLLLWTVLLSLPLIAVLALLRRRVPHTAASALLALSFAGAMFYTLYRAEWFDVWRHGAPSIRYVLAGYGPYLVVAAGVGWWVGGLIARTAVTRPAATDSA